MCSLRGMHSCNNLLPADIYIYIYIYLYIATYVYDVFMAIGVAI